LNPQPTTITTRPFRDARRPARASRPTRARGAAAIGCATWTWLAALGAYLQACSGAYGPPVDPGAAPLDASADDDAGVRDDAGIRKNAPAVLRYDAGIRDAGPDAFFINDEAPPFCGPDGGMSAPPSVGGTPECPDDKNRQGCGCPEIGKKAACWPGKRRNRNHGICMDGVTTCRGTAEFPPAWGPCEGYVLPVEGAVQGPEACRCFSRGNWMLSNLVPCIHGDGNDTYIYSSHPDPQRGFACDPISTLPPPTPSADWSPSTLNVDCAGHFELCYTMKAGNVGDPRPSDCTVMRSCVDVWYEHAGKSQKLPNLPGWSAKDRACAKRFVETGGYGEMSVLGKSAECDPVNDGHGEPYVFLRTAYCPANCVDTPDADSCKACSTSGTGSF